MIELGRIKQNPQFYTFLLVYFRNDFGFSTSEKDISRINRQNIALKLQIRAFTLKFIRRGKVRINKCMSLPFEGIVGPCLRFQVSVWQKCATLGACVLTHSGLKYGHTKEL